MKILITGITGFVGSHMADYLLTVNSNIKIFAMRRWRSRDENIKHLYGNSRVIFYEADLLDRGSLNKMIKEVRPDSIFHFAAQSFPESSFLTPIATLNTNIIGTTNLMEEIRIAIENKICDPIIISVSSSEVYGMPLENEIPIKESNPIRAANPYSISKVGHDLMSQYYFKAYGLKIIITRMFSHEGARRSKQFALSSFAHQIVQNEKQFKLDSKSNNFLKKTYTIKVGNLNSIRTYAHIDDAVHAYWCVSQKGILGEIYNIGGEYTCTVGEALEDLLSKSIISRECLNIEIDSKRIRPTDITLQIPDCTKFKEQTGWKPKKSLSDITDDLLNYWREVL